VCGDRVWDVQSAFRLRIGPLTYQQFVRFMPDGDELARLAHLTRLYVGPAMSFDVQLTLRKEDVPDLSLGDGEAAPRLGWNTWVKSEPFRRDADEAVYILDDL
jgi:type VI secretion system protein ImpH